MCSQDKSAQNRVWRATLCQSSCFQEAVLWYGIGEPEFQVLWRINFFDLLHSAKEDLDGIALVGDFVLVRAAELDLLLCDVLCLPCSLAAVTLRLIPHIFPFLARVKTAWSERH